MKPHYSKLISKDTNAIIELQSERTLLGSDKSCDLTIESSVIGKHHAYIYCDNSKFYIIDLNSESKTFVNQKEVTRKQLKDNDTLSLGGQEYTFIFEKPNFQDESISKDELTSLPTTPEGTPGELPPVPVTPMAEDRNFILPVNFKAFDNVDSIFKNIYFDESADIFHEEMLKDFESTNNHRVIEVSTLSFGNIIDVNYFALENADEINQSFSTGSESIVQLNSGNIFIQESELFKYLDGTTNSDSKLTPNKPISLNHNGTQIIFELVQSPPNIATEPFWGRDSKYKKNLSKFVGTCLSIMLLLLFVKTEQEEEKPKKQIAILYKMKKTDSAAAAKSASMEQPSDKLEMKKQKTTTVQKPLEKVVKKEVKKKTKAVKKIAKVKAPKKIIKKKFKLKTKSFRKIASITKSQTKFKPQKVNLKSSLAVSKSNSNKLSTKTKGKFSFGNNYKGIYKNSVSSDGISNKKGFDIDQISKRSIVKGSIDPELLRRLLRERLPQFRHCYQEELTTKDESIKGVIDLKFRINSNGRVSNINIKTKQAKFSNQGVNCMASVLRKIDFPNPKGGGKVDVKQPLNFYAQKTRI